MSNKEIASRLACSVGTVQKHRVHMVEKTGATGPGGLLRYLMRTRQPSKSLQRVERSVLVGHWLSRFSFQSLDRSSGPAASKYIDGAQINIERLEATTGHFSHVGRNLCGARKPLGTVYMHSLHFLVKHRTAVGIWDNGDNTDNVGCFQLFVYGDANMMAGHHLGNASNGAVRSGDWVWIKLKEPQAFEARPDRLRPYDDLNVLVEKFLNGGAAPSMADLFS
jgi:hypothetical protein